MKGIVKLSSDLKYKNYKLYLVNIYKIPIYDSLIFKINFNFNLIIHLLQHLQTYQNMDYVLYILK